MRLRTLHFIGYGLSQGNILEWRVLSNGTGNRRKSVFAILTPPEDLLNYSKQPIY